MIWPGKKKRVRRRMSKTIGLNVRGRPDPEVYRVCEDVYGILEKILSANQAIGPYSRHPRFDFAEVQFILELLGAPLAESEDGHLEVDLWISDG